MSERIARVRVGSVKVGDVLHGYRVTGFGAAWTLDSEHNGEMGAAPWETLRVCYAYGEKLAVAVANPMRITEADILRDKRARLMAELAKTNRSRVIRELQPQIFRIEDQLDEMGEPYEVTR